MIEQGSLYVSKMLELDKDGRSEQVHNLVQPMHEVTHWQDDLIVLVTLLGSFLLDACVIVTEMGWANSSLVHFLEFLTNQVMIYGLWTKGLLVVYLGVARGWAVLQNGRIEYSGSLQTRLVVVTFVCFFSYGACLWGVYGAFFVLIYYDDNLLNTRICEETESEQYRVGEVLIWNHIRHVFVLFIHMTLVHYLHTHLKFWYRVFTIHMQQNISKLCFVLNMACVLVVGGNHILWNIINNKTDSMLYQYKEFLIGHSVTTTFVLCCTCSSLFYVFTLNGSLNASNVTQ